MNEPLSPFGHNLSGKRPKGNTRTMWVYVGQDDIKTAAQRVHKDRFPWLALPAGEPPERFDWRGVAGWEVIVIDLDYFQGSPNDPALMHRLCVLLMDAGAALVFDATRGARGVIYRRAMARRRRRHESKAH